MFGELTQSAPHLTIAMMIISSVAIIASLAIVIYIIYVRAWREQPIHIIAFIINAAVFLSMYDAAIPRHEFEGDGFRMGHIVSYVKPQILLLITIGVLLFVIIRVAVVFRRMYHNITPYSVGEAIDRVPVGVMFYENGGRILQTNSTMEEIYYEMSGEALVDGKTFWEEIKETPVVTLKNGKSYSFIRNEIDRERSKIFEILAIDVTKEQELIEDKTQQNKKLSAVTKRLRDFQHLVDDTIKEEELLDAKKRVHDNMGSSLLAARIYLVNSGEGMSPVNAEDVANTWKNDISLLISEAEMNENDDLQRYIDAAKYLGVQLNVEGKLPEDEAKKTLICTGIQENLTNAVKHAGADTLSVKIEEDYDALTVTYTNNGNPVKRPIKEGGGLTFIRTEAEAINAEVEYPEGENFCMKITIPIEHEVYYYDQDFDSRR